MSVRIMSQVWDLALPTTQKLVLLALADHASDDGCNAYPSVDRLMRKCSLSERAVRYAIGRLVESGHLVLLKPATQNFPNSYQVVPSGVHVVQSQNVTGVHVVHPRGARGAPYPSVTTILPDPPSTEGRSVRSARKPKPPVEVTDGTKLVRHFEREFESRGHGEYIRGGAAEATMATQILKFISLNEASRRVDAYLSDPWPEGHSGYTFRGFRGSVNKYAPKGRTNSGGFVG